VRPDAAAAWAFRATELAAWAWRHLVVRQDVWGGYWEDFSSGERQLQKTTRPAVARRGRVRLTEAAPAAHFRGYRVGDLVGLHTTSTENTSRWGAVEVDYHGEGGNSPEANLAAVLAWYARLAGMRFRPLLTTSDGRGGFHLRVLLREPVSTARAFDFLRDLAGDYRRYGLSAPPETFPKQRQIDPAKYGNWLRLPGRHHTQPHWSLVYDGSGWLEGDAAIDFVLGLTGDDPALLPPERPPPPPRRREPATPGQGHAAPRVRGSNLSAEIAAQLGRFPARREGQNRDGVGYAAACYLLVDKAVSDDIARAWLEALDARNDPPKGEDAIEKWIRNAKLYARNRDKLDNQELSS
jgi:hypothetical protein